MKAGRAVALLQTRLNESYVEGTSVTIKNNCRTIDKRVFSGLNDHRRIGVRALRCQSRSRIACRRRLSFGSLTKDVVGLP